MATQKANFNAARQQAKPLTPEEQQEQIRRAVMQKKASLAEGILFNMVQGCGDVFSEDLGRAKYLVHVANEMADEFLKVVYHQELKVKEEE